jgi:hypothetical protein
VNPKVDTYTPMRPGDLVAVRRSTITAAEGARGYIVRQYWTHGELVCVIQLFARRSLSRMFIRDLQKISNT